ncbi:MAG TPA: peptidoglycan-associated outer membrane lipoprotein precursor [Lysobacter sp.]
MNTNLRMIGLAAVASVALAGCATTAGTGYGGGYGSTGGAYGTCYDCGVVTRIERVGTGAAPGSGATGAVIGGLVGAAAGRTIADDSSKGRRNTATAAGAAAGAVAGAAIQRNMSGGAAYNIHVRMDDGRTTVVTQNDLGGVREGSAVRVYNGRAVAR